MDFPLPTYAGQTGNHAIRANFNPPSVGAYDPQKLKEKHHAILRMVLQNKSDKEIAEALDCTPAMVAYTRKSTLGQQKIAHMRALLDEQALGVEAQLEQISPVIVAELSEMFLGTNDDKLKKDLGFGLLDRAGHGPNRKVDLRTGKLNQEDLDEIVAAARAGGMEIVEDAEIIEETDASS